MLDTIAFRIEYFLRFVGLMILALVVFGFKSKSIINILAAIVIVLLLIIPMVVYSYRTVHAGDEQAMVRDTGDTIKWYVMYIYMPIALIAMFVSMGFYYYTKDVAYLYYAGYLLLFIVAAIAAAYSYKRIGSIPGIDYL